MTESPQTPRSPADVARIAAHMNEETRAYVEDAQRRAAIPPEPDRLPAWFPFLMAASIAAGGFIGAAFALILPTACR